MLGVGQAGDYARAQKASRALEVRHGLEQLESAKTQRATRGYDPAEREAQDRGRAHAAHEKARAGGRAVPAWEALPASDRRALVAAQTPADQPRHQLARVVRGCATAAGDEGEFVRRMRRAGVLVRPRYAEGRTDVVTGYSVAARPQFGERPIWYGGRHLGRDLSLPRLREEWPDTPTAASDAVGEWNAAKRHRRPVAPGRETREADPALWGQYTQQLADLREQLRAVPIEDRETWARVAREGAGALAAWSQRLEDEPGRIAEASDALARSAQIKRTTPGPRRSVVPSFAGTALLLASASRGGQGVSADLALVRQLMKTTEAIVLMHRVAQEARQAEAVRVQTLRNVRAVVDDLKARYTGPVVELDPKLAAIRERLAVVESGRRPAGSPVPNRIEPDKPRVPTREQGRDSGRGR